MHLYLSIAQVCATLGATPSSKNFIEGEKILNENQLLACEATTKTKKEIHICAACVKIAPSDALPYIIEGVLEVKKTEVKVRKVSCTCGAEDNNRCEHVAATLLYCNRNNLAELNVMSSEDKKCLKNLTVDELSKPVSQWECCLSQRKPEVLEISEEMQKQIREKFVKACPNSMFALHMKGELGQALDKIDAESACVKEEIEDAIDSS